MDAEIESLLSLTEKVANRLLVAVQRVRSGSGIVSATPEALEQFARGVCLACDGKNQPKKSGIRRGQCDNCYPKTLRRLRSGKLDEGELILAGKLLPAGAGGRRDSDFALDDLAKDKAAADKLLKTSKGKKAVRGNLQRKGGNHAKPDNATA
jgi:hypothetical protein